MLFYPYNTRRKLFATYIIIRYISSGPESHALFSCAEKPDA